MKIVINHGRNPAYNFKKDKDLAKILAYKNGTGGKGSKSQNTLAFDGFLTIWLCTLPEKFKEWYDYHQAGCSPQVVSTDVMDLNETPTYPVFPEPKCHTRLSPHKTRKTYDYFPKSWNLLECFEYFYFKKRNLFGPPNPSKWN